MPKKSYSSFLHFTRKERRGSLFLLLVILLICLAPYFYSLFAKNKITDENKFDESLMALRARQAKASDSRFKKNYEDDNRPYDHPSNAGYKSYSSGKSGTLFYFDPNTLDEPGWKKLGLREKTIATIENFRNKGGKFRQPEDIKKIWGLFPDEAERLIPYVQIAATEENNLPKYETTSHSTYTKEKSFEKTLVNVNLADTGAFISLPGIGSKLSQRILNFRDKLGGFYAVDQVKETFGLPDSVYQKIKPLLQVSGEVTKININTASLDELKAHPYIRYHLANAIVQYRAQHGDYKTVEDVRKIMILDEATYTRLAPYLKTE
jgi:competence ComEA-like helix-hairpin-helix protein